MVRQKKRSPQTIAHIERLQYIGFIAHRVICGEALHHGAPMGTAQHHEWTAVETNMELEKLPSFGKKSKEKTRLERHPFLGGNCYTLVFRGVSLQKRFFMLSRTLIMEALYGSPYDFCSSTRTVEQTQHMGCFLFLEG